MKILLKRDKKYVQLEILGKRKEKWHENETILSGKKKF